MSDDEGRPLTISVPDAGRRYFDMSRGASYQAAGRGDIPTVRIGRLLRVPVKALDEILAGAKRRSDAQNKISDRQAELAS
jgi:hypothetical protein